MATVVNNAGSPTDNSGMGIFVAILLLIFVFFLFLFYGLPRLRGPNSTNTEKPTENTSGSEINVDIPEQIDINTNINPTQPPPNY